MISYILIAVTCLVIGGFITYQVLKPKLQKQIELNTSIIEQNEKNLEERNNLYEEIAAERRNLELTEFEVDKKKIELSNLNHEINLTQDHISNLKTQAQEAADIFYKQSISLVEEQLDRALENKAIEYQKNQEEYEKEYFQTLEDYVSEFVSKTTAYKKEYEVLDYTLKDLRARVNAAVEASRRADEEANKKEFYKLIIPQEDLEEISKLREVIPMLRDPEPLNKVIWKVYYEKPYTDLVGRVVGQGIKTGIYKITNIQNEKCYVGQAANIADRWRQHIKRGVGAEAPTRNKLYPAMLSIGVENFRFEVIEECDRSKLNEREDYWQDYFHAKDYGYSIK